MTAPAAPKISKWPFFLGDALLLALAAFICFQSKTPTGTVEIAVYLGCVAIGAWISITPFLKEYQAELKFAEADRLVDVTAQIKNLDQLAGQISYATSQWQAIRDAADKTANTAKSIAEGMATEVRSFNDFIQKTNEGEKATLRLEVDKLRRTEVEWVQASVRILDHVFALHHAALRSGQQGLIDQLGKFQMTCLDAVRRLGLTPFIAPPEEPFNAERHQFVDGPEAQAPEGAIVGETVAAGYNFQGRMIRPAVVRLKSSEPAAEAESERASESMGEAPHEDPDSSESAEPALSTESPDEVVSSEPEPQGAPEEEQKPASPQQSELL